MRTPSQESNGVPTINRRDFARWIAASAVATTMFQRAHADLKVGDLHVPEECQLTLTLIGASMTVQNFFYGSLADLLNTMNNNIPVKDQPKIGQDIANAHSYVQQNFETPPNLTQVYCYDASSPPPPYAKKPGIWTSFYAKLGTQNLRKNLTLPFLSLPNRQDDRSRVFIQELLTNATKYDFGGMLGSYKIQDLFLKKRSDVFPKYNEPADKDSERYRLIRGAFHLRIFMWTNLQTSSLEETAPNDQCFSQTKGTCTAMPGSYCEEDGNGNPTTASDLCP